jgi:hypothetical protein
MTISLLTFTAPVLSRPDIPNVRTYLARGVRALRSHPDVVDVTCRHNRRTHTVTFEIAPALPFPPERAVLSTLRALHDALRQAGIRTTRNPPARGFLPAVQIRLGTWPDAIQWG